MGITISTIDCSEEIKKSLTKNSDFWKEKGIDIKFAEEKEKDMTLFEIDMNDEGKNYSVNAYIADIIAGIVVNNLEKKMINKIVNHKYSKLSKEEREKIINLAINQSNEIMKTNKYIEKNKIVREILNYLQQNHSFNLEGFVRFRLKEYMHHIHLAINQAVDDIILEREYEEFIDLLQYFVGLQDVKISEVHVYKKKNKGYKILNDSGSLMKNNLIENYVEELMDEEITYEDILISSLINISPGKIIIHFENSELITTLKKIFKEKIYIDIEK